MQSEIRKILELADSTISTSQKPNFKKTISQKLPTNPLLPDQSAVKNVPSYLESHVISIKSNQPYADCEQVLQIYTPTTDSPDELKQRYQQTISLLQPPIFPPLDEDHYYEHICVTQKSNPRITYEQMVEIVDLSALHGFNFIVVADRLKHKKLDPVICMNTFLMYCDIQNHRKTQFQIDDSQIASEQYSKAIQTICFFSKTIQNFEHKTTDELDRQQTVRETWACFSPIRIAQKRFSYINGLLQEQLTLNLKQNQFDYTSLTQQASITQQQKTLYQIGQQATKTTKTTSYKSSNLAYNQQLEKSKSTLTPQISQAIPPENITIQQAIDKSKLYVDAQLIFSQEPTKQELDDLLAFYDSNLCKVDQALDGFNFESSSKLQISNKNFASRGALNVSLDGKKEAFPGHFEVDFTSEIQNFCTSASWRWGTEKVSFDGGSTDSGKVWAEEEKFEQKMSEGKYKKGLALRKRLAGKQINLQQFFALEALYK